MFTVVVDFVGPISLIHNCPMYHLLIRETWIPHDSSTSGPHVNVYTTHIPLILFY